MPTGGSERSLLVRYLPVAYFGAVMGLVVLLLPTSLRPPPEDPTTSAEFSPDAPPDDEADSILAALGRGGSGTVGAGAGEPEDGGLPSGTSEPAAPRNCPFGVGNPPRQVESIYAAPCAPAWQGDNGGETSKNVSRDEVRLGLYHSTDACEGATATEPPDNESAGHRTMRVLQDYVNQAFQTYERQIRLYCIVNGTPESAVEADQDWRVFAASNIDFRGCRELIRRKIPVWCDPPTREDMLANRPYLWSWQMDRTRMQEFGAEYYCKKLKGKPAVHAGQSSGYRSTERKLGIITEMSAETGLTYEPMIPALRRECGMEKDEIEDFVYTARGGEEVDTAEIATAIARLRTEGVTTVVLNIKFLNSVATLQASDSAAYFPEWLIFSPYGLDINIIGNLHSQGQMTQMFGLSGWEWPRATQETDCYKAYKSMDPNNNPGGPCGVLFDPLIQLVSGIQAAGPNLTPETFREGLFDIGYRFYPKLSWAIGGGYSNTDFTYIDNVAEVWWDPDQPKPQDGTPGAYRWVRCGERYAEGELPREDPRVFSDGGAGPGFNGCPSL